MVVKYGVIATSDLVDDLVNWNTFYVSGRMQKPVRILASTPEVDAAASTNLDSALAAALLLSPASFTDVELFTVRMCARQSMKRRLPAGFQLDSSVCSADAVHSVLQRRLSHGGGRTPG